MRLCGAPTVAAIVPSMVNADAVALHGDLHSSTLGALGSPYRTGATGFPTGKLQQSVAALSTTVAGVQVTVL